jgi:hypothetical protein
VDPFAGHSGVRLGALPEIIKRLPLQSIQKRLIDLREGSSDSVFSPLIIPLPALPVSVTAQKKKQDGQ